MTEITDYITNDYKAIDSEETIADVQAFFEDVSFSHFPVIDKESILDVLLPMMSRRLTTIKKQPIINMHSKEFLPEKI